MSRTHFVQCRRALVTVVVLSSSLWAQGATAAFVDATARLGVDAQARSEARGDYGSGAAFADLDGDGDLDLYVVLGKGQPNQLYELDQGGYWNVADAAGCADAGWGTAVKIADYDNDGDPDIFLANNGGPNRLFNNNGDGVFTDVTAVAGMTYTGETHGAAWGDFDKDGFLDLYVVVHARVPNLLYHNDGDGTFTEMAVAAGVADNDKPGYECLWFDYDNDNDLDIYISEDKFRGNELYRNEGNGTFTNVSLGSGANIVMNGMGIAPGDYDNDGFVDLYITNTPEGHVMLRNNGNGTFTNVAYDLGLMVGQIGWGTSFLDYDNDGDLDLYVVHWAMSTMQNPANILFRNDGGVFIDVTAAENVGDDGLGYGLAVGDYNEDGFVDMFVVNRDGASVFYENRPNASRWLKVRTRGRLSNRDGIGARVTVVTGGSTQIRDVSGGSGYLSQNSLEVEFGVSAAVSIDRVEVRWPSGLVDVFSNVSTNQTLTVTEGETVYAPGTYMKLAATVGINVTPLGQMGRDFGTGAAFNDFDGDGNLDLYVATFTGQPNRLYRNNGKGFFVDVADQAGVADPAMGKTVAFADYDNDGDQDIFVANYTGANRLYRNAGNGTFVEQAVLARVNYSGKTAGATWGDYDADGWLDLHLANYREPDFLYHNNKDGTFTEVGAAAGVANALASLVSEFVDYDNDGDLDLFLAVDKDLGNSLYRNEGDGTFTDVSVAAGADQKMNAMGIAVGDYDANGYMDLYISNNENGNALLRNNGNGTFTNVATDLGVRVNKIGWGNAFFDRDNDGDVDLYVVNWAPAPGEASKNTMFRNDGGAFVDITDAARVGDTAPGFALTLGDYNSDGFLDMFVNNQGYPSSFYECIPTANTWIKIRTVGVISNRDGIGARIITVAGGKSQMRDVGAGASYLAHHSQETGFGFGAAGTIESIEVRWPSGFVDTFHDVAVRQVLTIREGDSREPLALTGFAADAVDAGVNLVWSASWTFGFDGYRIYRRLAGATAEELLNPAALLAPNASAYTDRAVLPSTVYEYRVAAVLPDGSEVLSEIVQVESKRGALSVTSVSARTDGKGVAVEWAVNFIDEVDGYLIYREEVDRFEEILLNGDNILHRSQQRYVDETAEPSREYLYTVAAIRLSDGTEIRSAATRVSTPAVPFALFQNRPNPFNPRTTIAFSLPENAHVTLDVYDAAGRLVARVFDGPVRAGRSQVDWDGADATGRQVPSGVYFYTIKSGGLLESRKMLRLK